MGREVLAYGEALYGAVSGLNPFARLHVQKMKMYLNFLSLSMEATGQFVHEIRRVNSRADFFGVYQCFVGHGKTMLLEPFGFWESATCLPANAEDKVSKLYRRWKARDFFARTREADTGYPSF
jgi:hypothetical protein